MRTFATGIVALPALLLLAALVSVTVIGLPVAAVGLMAVVAGTLAGVFSVLETLGGALLAHRTKNPYVHLAAGALAVLIAGSLPVVGSFVTVAVVFTALGTVVITRGAGMLPSRLRGGSPYRTADAQ